MKNPKTFKLPRKLKKEIKKGFRRIEKRDEIFLSDSTFSTFWSYSYTTNSRKTKSFYRLVKIAEKEQKKYFKKLIYNKFSTTNQLLHE